MYEGQFKNGKQNGTGFFTTAKYVARKSEWKDGKKIAWL